MSMNPAQQQAVDSRTPVILVSAGAGSGKTRVLTQRYLDLVTEGHERLERILTLTFKRKAAQEMRERIARGLEERGRAHLRPELMRAPIGTIHGFCERVLRDYALQAGIDPHFRVLEEAESSTLLEHALDTLFLQVWADTTGGFADIIRLLRDYSQDQLRGALRDILRALRTRGLSPLDPPPPDPHALSGAAQALCFAIEDLLALPGGGKWPGNLAKAQAAYEALQALLPQAAEFSGEIAAQANELLKPLTPPGGPSEAAAARHAVKEAHTAWLAAYYDLGAVPHRRAFTDLLRRLERLYAQAKDALGLLDFEDLLLRTRDLLADPHSDAARHFRRKFAQVMVDEFQDTNPLQFDLIATFRGDGHLFMVGDVKQSIYRFIGSDVRVFLGQEQAVAALDAPEGLRIAMAANYRTRPEVLHPLNALFARLWTRADGTPARAFTFEPLEAGRACPPAGAPAIEVALWPGDEGKADALREREASWIARRILQLIGRLGPPLVLADGEATRPAGFGDIIVLFRASTDIARYETALRQAGVPYYTVSGRGFFGTREVQDLLALLAVLENPCDDFSLAVALRSPLAGVCDDTLYWLTRDWRGWAPGAPYPGAPRADAEFGRIWETLQHVEALPVLPAAERDALVTFRALVHALQEALPAGQPLDLIDRILERTGFAVGLLAAEDGEQRFANVQKLREVAATFQARGIFDLTDFRRYLAQLSTLAPREPAAPLDTEGSPVVRLMTIHAAKGLEAPIVFLADMGRKPTAPTSPFLLHQGAVACRLPQAEGGFASPAAYQAALEAAKAEDAAEMERLLYVALTRARDHLICCGLKDFAKATGSYSDILAGCLGVAEAAAEDRTLSLAWDGTVYPVTMWSPDALKALEALPTPPQPPTLWEQYGTQILAGRPLPVRTDAREVERFEAALARLRPPAAARHDRPLRVGVYRLITYYNCPRAFWFRYVLHREGIPTPALREGEPEREPEETADDEAARLDHTTFGTLLHAAMQGAVLDETLPAQAPALLAQAATELKLEVTAADARALEAALRRLAALPVYARLTRAHTVHRELRFLAGAAGLFIHGIIDVLAQDADGWFIVDYKTGGPSADHARQVGLYALGVQLGLGLTPATVDLAYLAEDVARPLREEPVTPVLLDEAHRLLAAVAGGLRDEQYPPLPGPRCAACPYLDACPAGRALPLAAV